MTTLINHLYTQYRYITEYKADPRTEDFLFVKPLWVIGIIGIYLHFVYKSGSAFMKKKKPYKLNKILQLYNIMQIILNGYLLVILLGLIWKYKFVCEPVDYSNNQFALQVTAIVWFYYMLKIFDLLDTIFFILRKKQNQITFLHVYHHAGMIIVTWVGIRYLPGGHGVFLGLINTFVHIIMYTHYLWTSLNLGKAWWKKYITQLQIFQFIIIFLQFLSAILTKDCGYPKVLLLLFIPHNIFMIVLFTDFYYKSYIQKKSSQIDKNGLLTRTNQSGVELSNGRPNISENLTKSKLL
ncbi:hypothetical protein HZH68_001898 [Vespula germanica]|uniref:Elongation of very long chain fatty acids protein n=1 Tax=Vespula germanica TaxID=30212 RepID=A0A834KST6_VESGE|nr:hypothetical protein HZH68_001898 [Vespula germanica]